MAPCVYEIRCKLTGEVYIGSTVRDPEVRLEEHVRRTAKWTSMPRESRGRMPSMASRIIARGDYEHKVLEEMSRDDPDYLLRRERYHCLNTVGIINKYLPGTQRPLRYFF